MKTYQLEFQQGIAKSLTVDATEYGSNDLVAAVINPSTSMRYVADKTTVGNIVTFTWPSGLDNNLELDDEHTNGTAHMTVGNYDLEIYTSDRTDIGIVRSGIRVVSSNLMAINAPVEE